MKILSRWRAAARPALEAAAPFAQFPPNDPRSTVLVTLLSADAARRDRAIRFHTRRGSYRPVFVVTDPDIAAFRNAGSFAEHLPAPDLVRRFAAMGAWRQYLVGRWSLIGAKWQPDMAVTEGVSFDDYLRECGLSDTV